MARRRRLSVSTAPGLIDLTMRDSICFSKEGRILQERLIGEVLRDVGWVLIGRGDALRGDAWRSEVLEGDVWLGNVARQGVHSCNGNGDDNGGRPERGNKKGAAVHLLCLGLRICVDFVSAEKGV